MEAHLEGMNLHCSHISEPPLMSDFEHNLKFTVLAYIKIWSQFFQESQAVEFSVNVINLNCTGFLSAQHHYVLPLKQGSEQLDAQSSLGEFWFLI